VKLKALAPGKVNLSLFLGPIRADDRHELVTLIESVSLADELTLQTVQDGRADAVQCEGVAGNNLVAEAIARLRERGWEAPPVAIDVVKHVPIAGGMGGGSADAAAALRLAVELAPGRAEEVVAIASELGSDVPSQLASGLVLTAGGGELVESEPPLAAHALVIVPLGRPLATADVYGEADRLGLPRSADALAERYDELSTALRSDARLPEELLVNDLERAAVALCPPIKEALDAVEETGVDQTLVCGSGPTVAGILWGPSARERAEDAASRLRARYVDATVAVPVGPEFGMPVIAGS
jgi:4-diphosphocytidyl-2-C-methyl-D-erythritol kinase